MVPSSMTAVQTLVLCICLFSPIFAQTPTCGGHFRNDNGEISTPDYPSSYPYNTNCTWVIEVPTGFVVELKFKTFDIESIEKNCEDDDVVKVFDGANEKSPPLHTRLCGKDIPRDFISNGNHMTIVFMSTEDSMGAKGFLATYSAKPADQKRPVFNQCGGIIENTQSGYLQSPGYPQGYKENLNCTWTIKAPEGCTIGFHFHDLMLDSLSYKCTWNNVTLYNSNDKSIIYETVCDMHLNHIGKTQVFKTTDSSMTIVLRTSQASTDHLGFFGNFYVIDAFGARSTTTPPTSQPSTASTTTKTITSPTTKTATISSTASQKTPVPTSMPVSSTTLYKAISSKAKTSTSSMVTSTIAKSESGNSPVVTSKSSKATTTSLSNTSTKTTSTESKNAIANNPAAVSGLVIGCIVGVVVIVFGILLLVAFFHWRRQNHRFNIRLREEDAQSDVNTLISNTDSRETVYKGKKYGKIVRIPTSEEFPL